MVARARQGAVKIGLLIKLLILVVIAYFAVDVGEVYWRYNKFGHEMRAQVRMADHRTDEQIMLRLRAVADSLDLPPEARQIYIRRSGRHIELATEYWEYVEFPGFIREFHLQPSAEGAY